jgi:glucose-6-phosphate isomerase
VIDARDAVWTALAALPRQTLPDLFAADPARVEKLSGRLQLEEGGILFDWSKTHLSDPLLEAPRCAAACLPAKWSTPAKAARQSTPHCAGWASPPAWRRPRRCARGWAAGRCDPRRRAGRGAAPDPIGIGGSALGPALAVDALARDLALVDVHVVSNIDGVALEAGLSRLRSGDHADRGRLQDLHHHRDHDQCRQRAAWLAENGVAIRRAGDRAHRRARKGGGMGRG